MGLLGCLVLFLLDRGGPQGPLGTLTLWPTHVSSRALGLVRNLAVAILVPGNASSSPKEEELRQQVQILKLQVAELRHAQEENERLRALLHAPRQPGQQAVLCTVIGRDPTTWNKYRTLTLDKGAEEGLTPRTAVVAAGGLLGRVYQTTSHTAQVLLISDSSSGVGAQVLSSRDVGVVKGLIGADLLLLSYLPKDARVRRGDQVITSGSGEVFPRGLLVGTVTAVSMDPKGFYQRAWVRPAADLEHIDYVLALVGGGR